MARNIEPDLKVAAQKLQKNHARRILQKFTTHLLEVISLHHLWNGKSCLHTQTLKPYHSTSMWKCLRPKFVLDMLSNI